MNKEIIIITKTNIKMITFQIIYSNQYKLYDFTILDSKQNVLHHYHYPSLKTINKIIQTFK